MERKRVIYFGLLFIVTVMVIVTSFSYAFLIKTEEHHGKLNMVVGTLDYKLSSKLLNNNSITLNSNEKAKLNIKIESLNATDSKYELFYTTTNNSIEIGYTSLGDQPTGTIEANSSKSVNVIIKNTSNSSATITFGIIGGFTGNTLVKETGTSLVAYNGTYCGIAVNTQYNFDYTGESQEFNPPCSGNYKVELWGGSGYETAHGAYVSGNSDFDKDDVLYVYVGPKTTGTGYGEIMSFNAGTGSSGGWSGGGATDIRLVGGNWDDTTSLNSRVMVAGAGGSASSSNIAGAAGGLIGYDGSKATYPTSHYSLGGTQEPLTYQGNYTTSYFGIANGGCTGGNGYYPANGAACANGGGGGSSFISGHTGCVAITSEINQSPKSGCTTGTINNECSKHYSGLYFTNTKMIDGKGYNWTNVKGSLEQMPNPVGGNYPSGEGNSGNGYARITYLGDSTEEEKTNIGYTIRYHANGGTGSMPNQTFASNETKALSSNTFTNTGKTFVGWSDVSGNQLLYSGTAEVNATNDRYGDSNWLEFMQYGVDLSPYFDTYGSREYSFMLDAKSENTSNHNVVDVYGQNGSGARWSFSYGITVTTSYNNYVNTFIPIISNSSLAQTQLAFYGVYNTGNYPTVKNVYLFLGKFYKNSMQVSNLTDIDGGIIDLYAVWK